MIALASAVFPWNVFGPIVCGALVLGLVVVPGILDTLVLGLVVVSGILGSLVLGLALVPGILGALVLGFVASLHDLFSALQADLEPP